MISKKYIVAFLFVLILFILGFFRDYIFVNINGQLYYLFYQKQNPYLSKHLEILNHFSYKQLFYFKFWLTGVFFLIYLIGSLLVIKTLFVTRSKVLLTMNIYLLVFITSFLIYGIGLLFGFGNAAYTISRFMIGWVQSPLALFVIIPAFFFLDNN